MSLRLEERINGCFERSMNGKNLKENSKEMKALLAYMNWLGRYVKEDEIINGKGLLKINYPDRAVNLINGKQVFDKHCVECHNTFNMSERYFATISDMLHPFFG